ncbi:integrin beta-1-A-like isoform X2 [Corticium candelabrum]|nr:integrin beta-1-A-like isoform X2 [Corticium candelabrum]
MWMKVLSSLLTLSFIFVPSCRGQGSESLCEAETECGKCISASPDCAWCGDEESVLTTRCRPRASWTEQNCKEVFYPRGRVDTVEKVDFSETVQISPQQFNISMRPGETVTFNVTVRLADNYPVDLYYLMDLSYSMDDDLDVLPTIARQMQQGLKNRTKRVRLGFGTFIEKPVFPFSEENSEFAVDVAGFTFVNNLPLSKDIQKFIDKVKEQRTYFNLDEPEGSLDALIQVIACQREIKWQSDARRIVVVATDYGFHIAGDGKLGGAVVPHDGNCYLDKTGKGGKYRDDVARRLDYPSISLIDEKLTSENIIPVFAVTENVEQNYTGLAGELTAGFVGKLDNNSGNVAQLIQDIYDDIVSSVIPITPRRDGLNIGIKAFCPEGAVKGPKGTECHQVPLGTEATFMFSVTADSCEDIERIQSGVEIKFVGLGNNVKLAFTPVCDCDCEKQRSTNSSQCNGGSLVCGHCECLPGSFGRNCECEKDSAETEKSCHVISAQNSTNDVQAQQCYGHGECVCGLCLCQENFIGPYCQCNRLSCDRGFNGLICSNQGQCNCKAIEGSPHCDCSCTCQAGFTGPDCDCTTSTYECKAKQSDAFVCSKHGQCECGKCVCDEGYIGLLCDTALSNPNTIDDICAAHEDCAECLAFASGPKARTCSEATCPQLLFDTELPDGVIETDCPNRKTDDDCEYSFSVLLNRDNTVYGIRLKSEKKCPKSFPYLFVILGLVIGLLILFLIPLIIWKLVTWYLDNKEYTQFQKDQKEAQWSKTQNPIYQQPVQRNVNPAFGRGATQYT